MYVGPPPFITDVGIVSVSRSTEPVISQRSRGESERATLRYDRCLCLLWLWTTMFAVAATTIFIIFKNRSIAYNVIGLVLLVIALFLLSMAFSMCRSKEKHFPSNQDEENTSDTQSHVMPSNNGWCIEEYVQQSAVTGVHDFPPPYHYCITLPSYSEAVLTSNSSNQPSTNSSHPV